MLKKIALVVVALIAVLLGYAAAQPDTFRVERSTIIKASPEKVFALVADFRQWGSWSPWERLDATMQRTLSGAPNGKGAVYEWEGNSKVGKGRMEIMEVNPNSSIVIKLDFLKPFEAHNTAEYTLKPKGDATEVTWAMYGPNNFLSKLMHIFVSMDGMVGKDFETGLANMKAVAER